MINKIKVIVTKDDIKAGHVSDAYECPLGLALMRAANAEEVRICSTVFVMLRKNKWAGGKLSKRAQDFVDCFDKHKKVKPAVFTLTED